MPAPLLWVNGFPGSGKLTVMRAFVELLGTDRAVLKDNHQLIDPVEAVTPRGHPLYQKERQLQRKKVFQEHVFNPEMASQFIIFTDFQSDNELGRSVAKEYQSVSSESGRPFFPIIVTCDINENKGRIATPERINSGTGKLHSVEILEDLHSRCELFKFNVSGEIYLDLTNLSPSEAAEKLLQTINTMQTNL